MNICKVVATLALAMVAVSGCQTEKPRGPGSLSHSSENTALSTMERVAVAANSCWFKSKDPAFRGYAMAPELNSFSGRPRFLVVPATNPAARPLLVVQAEGNPARVEAFGPMMHQAGGSRIAADVRRWSDGAKDCRS